MSDTDTMIVNVKQGDLRGKKMTAFNGATYYSFQGIPYAKPPVGALRFKAPQPPEAWIGIRDALKEGQCAPQIMPINGVNHLIGNEDCLFVNVYTPQLPIQGDKKKAVMVWIHGGAFAFGSGGPDLYGPDHLVAGEVVLVTLNYRLSALGFLYTEDTETSGNVGLKDQVMALRWVQQNIAQFGGDPNNVTIFGESAGGVSVHGHVLSPMSKGLFHKAVAQSGSVLNPWGCIPNARERAFRIGATLGCNTTDSRKLVEFLCATSTLDLLQAVGKTQTMEEKMRFDLYCAPCVENVVAEGDEKFLPADPFQLISEGKFNKVPFIAGFTSHEGMMMLRDFNLNPSMIDMISSQEEGVIPYTRKLKKNTVQSKKITSEIKKFYFGDKRVCKESLPELIDMYGDAFFIHGIRKTVELQVQHSDNPVYMYQFSFDEDLPFINVIVAGERLPGACHGGDFPYLFKGNYFTGEERLKSNAEHMKMVNIMVKLWTNFAKTGNPTPNGEKDVGVKWEPVTKSGQIFLDITLTPCLKADKERYIFWDGIQAKL